MMNMDNHDMDLTLALDCSSQSVRTGLKNNSGAGANAASRLDMALAASLPLAELVWSPQEGLSLKCVDCSLIDKKPSLFWDVGPSNMVFSPSDRPINEGKLIESEVKFQGDSEVVKHVSLGKSPVSTGGPVFGSSHGGHMGTGGTMEEVNTVEGVSVIHFNQEQEYQGGNEKRSLCSPKKIQLGNIAEASETNAGQENRKTTDIKEIVEPLPVNCNRERMTDHIGRIEDIYSGGRTLGLEIALASEFHSMKQREGLDDPVSNLPSPKRRHAKSALVIEERENKVETHGHTSAPLPEKLESTSENDIQHLIYEERLQRDKPVPVEASSSDSRIRLNQRKGKERALSDRDVNERKSKDGDDTLESMESCNSAGLFSKGKKRWSVDQQLTVGSKRIKKQIQESPSASLVRYDSSFINWISNMVKGVAKSNQDVCPPLALTLDHTNHGLESYDRKIVTCSKIHDSGCRNVGFQTTFQSLYCPNTMVWETGVLNKDFQKPMFRLNTILPSQTSTSSDSMASVFARRLDALRKKPQMTTDHSFDLTSNRRMIYEKRISSLEEVQKHIASNSGEDGLKENKIMPLCNLVSTQISDAPKGMLDIIRSLHLSRMDILKWMNSHISLSHLDGFFLRLRLGKWEGLRRTGYYVACITGMQRENSSKKFKSLISVSVGGIKCLVEIQYVSNHDFLEDELMAWWLIASRSGTIPTEDDLKSKFEERKRLGF